MRREREVERGREMPPVKNYIRDKGSKNLDD
jgi:hypothetical protein